MCLVHQMGAEGEQKFIWIFFYRFKYLNEDNFALKLLIQLNFWLGENCKLENNTTVALNILNYTTFKILDKKLSTVSWAAMTGGFLLRMLWVRNVSKIIWMFNYNVI